MSHVPARSESLTISTLAPDTDRREAFLKLQERLADVDNTTSEKLDGLFQRISLSNHADDLAALPSIKRTVEEPSETEDILVETYADVRRQRRAGD